jgi:uncharacterized membrane protein
MKLDPHDPKTPWWVVLLLGVAILALFGALLYAARGVPL